MANLLSGVLAGPSFLLFLFLLEVFLSVLRNFQTHAPVLWRAVLIVNCLKLLVLGHARVQNFLYQVLGARAQLNLLNVGAFRNLLSPDVRITTHLTCKVERAGRKHRWGVFDHRVRYKAALHHVLGEETLGFSRLCEVAVALKEAVSAGYVQFKV